MADVTWSALLPQSFQKDSFTETAQSAVLRTNMDSGPPKVRRLFTSALDYWSGTMIMTASQISTFKTFFKSTVQYGSLPFNFPNQYNLSEFVEVRFLVDTEGEPYSIRPDGDTLEYAVQFTLEVFV